MGPWPIRYGRPPCHADGGVIAQGLERGGVDRHPAAAAMGVTSSKLEELGIVDATIPEPLGGAHRDPVETANRLKSHLLKEVDRLSSMDTEAMLEARRAWHVVAAEADRHHPDVGLVTEHCCRDHLAIR